MSERFPAHMDTPPPAVVKQVIEVEFRRGRGVDGDPVRIVRAYYELDGTLLAEHDAWLTGKVDGALLR